MSSSLRIQCPAAAEADILAGLTYVDVHTAAHTGGEIRGQVIFPQPCPPDFNCDCQVDAADLAELLGSWGPCPSPCPPDLTGDGMVSAGDLALLLGAWGSCP